MIIDLDEEEIEWIKRVCKHAVEFQGIGITVRDIKDYKRCQKILDKLENLHDN